MCNQPVLPRSPQHILLLCWLPSILPALVSVSGTCLLDCLLYKITRPHCSCRTENAAEWDGESRVLIPTLHRQSRVSAEFPRATRKAGSRSGTPAKAFLVCVCWKATVWIRLQLLSLNPSGRGWYWLLLRPMPQWPQFCTLLFLVYLRGSLSYGAENLQMKSGLEISINMQKPGSFSMYSTISSLIFVIISILFACSPLPETSSHDYELGYILFQVRSLYQRSLVSASDWLKMFRPEGTTDKIGHLCFTLVNSFY